MKKLLFKKKLKLKTRQPKRRIRYIKDKAINDFLLQHLTPVKIDFSKVKNCLLNLKDEKVIDKLFPKLKGTNEANMKLKNSLANFKCDLNFI